MGTDDHEMPIVSSHLHNDVSDSASTITQSTYATPMTVQSSGNSSRLMTMAKIFNVLLGIKAKESALQTASDGARALTDANISFVKLLDKNGSCLASSNPAHALMPWFNETHHQLLDEATIIRWVSCGYTPHKSCIASRLVDKDGEINGYIMVSDRFGGEFSTEDEVQLAQLAMLVSLCLQRIEAQEVAEIRTRELAESEQRFQALFERNLDAVFLTKPDGTVLNANPAACAMLGMTKEEICRVGRQGVVEDNEALDSFLQQRAKTGSAKAELTMIRKDGTRLLVEHTSTLITASESGMQSFV